MGARGPAGEPSSRRQPRGRGEAARARRGVGAREHVAARGAGGQLSGGARLAHPAARLRGHRRRRVAVRYLRRALRGRRARCVARASRRAGAAAWRRRAARSSRRRGPRVGLRTAHAGAIRRCISLARGGRGMSEPAVSVVIPTRDRAEQLARCVGAIAAAARPAGGVEVVVVNDGGAPLEGAALAAVGDGLAIRVLDQPGGGPAGARNRGAAAAAGRVLAFTDDDCEPALGWLAALGQRLGRGPGAAAAAGRVLAFTDDDCEPALGWLAALGQRLDRDPDVVVAGRAASLHPDNDWAAASQLLTDHLHRWYNRDPEHGSFATSNNLALRAETFHALGGFDASFPSAAAEDREFAERALRAGHRLVYEPNAIVGHGHRLTGRSFLRQHYGYGRGARRVLRARRRAGGGMFFEPPGFYMQMLRSPWREYAGARPARLTLMLAGSQAAHTAGFVREGL